jgi:hypothetical protein
MKLFSEIYRHAKIYLVNWISSLLNPAGLHTIYGKIKYHIISRLEYLVHKLAFLLINEIHATVCSRKNIQGWNSSWCFIQYDVLEVLGGIFFPRHSIPLTHYYEKGGLFSIGCCQLISKIIIGIDWIKTADTNKCPAWPIFKALLVLTGLR